MERQLIVSTAATLAATEYPVAGYDSPFLVGNKVILAITKTTDYAGGNVTVRTDNSETDGTPTFETVRAAADADGATTETTELMEITLGDNIEITVAARTAGTITFALLSQ